MTLVYDNRGYGEIREAMDDAGDRPPRHRRHDARPAAIAAGFGVAAVRSASLPELEQQLADALGADGPTVIEYCRNAADVGGR